jgi:PAS domain-containing protein
MVNAPRAYPPFLAAAFDADELEQLASSIAVIDMPGSILWVNPAWERFARENGAVVRIDGHGAYLNAISDPLRSFYRSAFANALVTGDPFEQDYECSSPEKRRLFHLRALPIEGHALLVEHSLLVEEAHGDAAHAAAEADYLTDKGLILQCSNCRRVRRATASAWDRVPAWVAKSHPRTSHVICPSCVAFYWGPWRRTP